MCRSLLGSASKLNRITVLGTLASLLFSFCTPMQSASANVQLPAPIAISAAAGSAAGTIVIYPATKAPKAAVGAKWVGVSYRIDGFEK